LWKLWKGVPLVATGYELTFVRFYCFKLELVNAAAWACRHRLVHIVFANKFLPTGRAGGADSHVRVNSFFETTQIDRAGSLVSFLSIPLSGKVKPADKGD
jgi:hypothetical protein